MALDASGTPDGQGDATTGDHLPLWDRALAEDAGSDGGSEDGAGCRAIATTAPAILANPRLAPLAGGLSTTCAIRPDGRLWCWGSLALSPAATSSAATHSTPQLVASPEPDLLAVSLRHSHSCVLSEDRALWCSGSNTYGELGDGTTEQRDELAPVPAVSGEVVDVAVGGFHTCVLVRDGQAACFGHNLFGKLGTGDQLPRVCPTSVSEPPEPLVVLAAGPESTCAIGQSGAVYCWGWNNLGQLGVDTALTREESVTVPRRVLHLSSAAVALSAGHAHTCALLGSGEVDCWGVNWYGQTGNDDGQAHGAGLVRGLPGPAIAIAAGGYFSCAALSAGGVWCWGLNTEGELGNGTLQSSATPTAVHGLPAGRYPYLAGGFRSACAMHEDSRVFCWGSNTNGQVGNGRILNHDRPISSEQVTSGTAVHLGGSFACVLSSTGEATCWGDNSAGQLGDPSLQPHVGGVALSAEHRFVTLGLGRYSGCGATLAGAGVCWPTPVWTGEHYVDLGPAIVPGLETSTRAAVAGMYHFCAVSDAGAVLCWGANDDGQLGLGHQEYTETPTQVPGLGPVQRVALGAHHTCAVLASGAVSCWGDNDAGQLGDGTRDSRAQPAAVPGLPGMATDLALSWDYTCGAFSDGSVLCWGDNRGSSTAVLPPGAVQGIAGAVVQLSGGDGFSCALTDAQQVFCWSGARGTVRQVDGFPLPPTSLAAFAGTACAVLDDLTVACWGDDDDGLVTGIPARSLTAEQVQGT